MWENSSGDSAPTGEIQVLFSRQGLLGLALLTSRSDSEQGQLFQSACHYLEGPLPNAVWIYQVPCPPWQEGMSACCDSDSSRP